MTPQTHPAVKSILDNFAEWLKGLNARQEVLGLVDYTVLKAQLEAQVGPVGSDRMTVLPPLVELLKRLVDQMSKPIGDLRSEEVTIDDPELAEVANIAFRDVTGLDDERAVPLFLAYACYAVVGSATGVAIGAAAKKAWNNL